jgi:hypothetical protein
MQGTKQTGCRAQEAALDATCASLGALCVSLRAVLPPQACCLASSAAHALTPDYRQSQQAHRHTKTAKLLKVVLTLLQHTCTMTTSSTSGYFCSYMRQS